MQDSRYQEQLFKKFFELPEWKKTQALYSVYFGNPTWWFIPKISKKFISEQKNLICDREHLQSCMANWIRYLLQAKHSRQPVIFSCHEHYVYCFPLYRGDKLYGSIGVCNVQKKIPDELVTLFDLIIKTILEDAQKDLELSRLYETIRPRAIALSTVHTVNRIISSDLDLDDLLPRVARLTLQVLKARRCSIMLMDKDKNILVPKAIIDLKRKKINLNNISLNEGLPGRVAKTGKAVFKNQFISIPLLNEEIIIGVITVSNHIDKKPFTLFDFEILTTLSEQAVIAIKNAQLYARQEKITLGSIKALSAVLDAGAQYHSAASATFANIALAIGNELRMSDADMRTLYFASLLHHAGKTGIPEKIVKKRSRLTGKEIRIIKEHPIAAAQIIKPLDTMEPVIPIIMHHHERYDGTGYPHGLKKDEIPLGARIFAVADAFDAMISKRAYRKSMSIKQAVNEIVKNSFTQFDPQVVNAFVKVIKKADLKKLLSSKNQYPGFTH